MAKDAHDREDLLRDATGFPDRVEFRLADVAEPVFCGFKEIGAFSLYWTADDVLQFNTACELRRAFWKDRMIASYKSVPHWLGSRQADAPNAPADRVRLERQPFTDSEVAAFKTMTTTILKRLREAIRQHEYELTGSQPHGPEVLDRVAKWLEATLKRDDPVRFALHPGVGRK